MMSNLISTTIAMQIRACLDYARELAEFKEVA